MQDFSLMVYSCCTVPKPALDCFLSVSVNQCCQVDQLAQALCDSWSAVCKSLMTYTSSSVTFSPFSRTTLVMLFLSGGFVYFIFLAELAGSCKNVIDHIVWDKSHIGTSVYFEFHISVHHLNHPWVASCCYCS